MADFYPGLSDAEAADISGGTSTGSTGTADSTNWFNNIASLATAGANAYRSATGKPPAAKPATNLLPIIFIGAVGLVLVLVLALKR